MILGLAAALTGGQVSAADRPAFVAKLINEVAAKRTYEIGKSFREIVEVGEDRSSPITAERLVRLLSECTESGVRPLYKTTYVVDYQCTARRPSAQGCDSGDLFLLVDGDRSSLAVARSRKLTPECPPPAPPVPLGYDDPKAYYAVTKQILDSALLGDGAALKDAALPTGKIYFAPNEKDYRDPVPLTSQMLRELLAGCTKEKEVQVDRSGATLSFRCSNSVLKGTYVVDFDYVGKWLNRVWIMTPETRAKFEKAAK